MKRLVPIALLLTLGGCAAPIALTIATLAIDGLSWATTGKSTSDHVLSATTDKDCRMTRVLQGQPICANTQVVFATGPGPDAHWPEFSSKYAAPRGASVVADATPTEAEIAAAANTAPAAGIRPGYEARPTAGASNGRRGVRDLVYRYRRTKQVRIIQARSIDSRLSNDSQVQFVELSGFADGAKPHGVLKADGTLEIYMSSGNSSTAPVVRIKGFAKDPALCSGVLVDGMFYSSDAIIRS